MAASCAGMHSMRAIGLHEIGHCFRMGLGFMTASGLGPHESGWGSAWRRPEGRVCRYPSFLVVSYRLQNATSQ
eukprot:1628126-Prymnesium_polylepis.1